LHFLTLALRSVIARKSTSHAMSILSWAEAPLLNGLVALQDTAGST